MTTKQRILMIAVALSLATGGVYSYFWSDATLAPDAADIFDWTRCTSSSCGTASCNAMNNHLTDAGSPCVVRLAECLARRQDAGPGARYWQVSVEAMRCPVAGGVAWAIAVDDAGTPLKASVQVPFPCAWRPLGVSPSLCMRFDGGTVGDETTMDPGEWTGAGCVRKACREAQGDSSAP